MENIIEPHANFDFTKLSLGVLSSIQGGAYFTKVFFENKPLYIQTPSCSTKQGFIKHGKKIYSDLMFNNNDEIFINWLENLETKCQQLIYEKADAWFASENKLDLNDIESAFTSPIKTFKSGKFYLLRVNAKPTLPIYGETQGTIKIEDVNIESSNISILEIQGIKFTSRNFQIEIELKQTMIVSPDPFLESCFIKKPAGKRVVETDKQSTLIDNGVSANSLGESIAANIITANMVTDNLVVNPTETKLTAEKMESNSNLTEDEINQIISTQMKELDLLEDIEHANVNVATNTNISSTKTDFNVEFDVEDLNIVSKKESDNGLTEIDIHLENSLETITLKKPNHVYYEIYKQARIKAKEAKKSAIKAYLEAKNIKKTYMLEDIDDSDDSDNSDEDYVYGEDLEDDEMVDDEMVDDEMVDDEMVDLEIEEAE